MLKALFNFYVLKVHVVDLKTRETVDVVDISGVDLVNSAPFFQGLATGGNVSQAMVMRDPSFSSKQNFNIESTGFDWNASVLQLSVKLRESVATAVLDESTLLGYPALGRAARSPRSTVKTGRSDPARFAYDGRKSEGDSRFKGQSGPEECSA